MKQFKGIQNCDKENKQRQFDCINRFISNRLNCSFPWDRIQGINKFCQSAEEVDKYHQIYSQIMMKNPELQEDLKKFGCTLQNCIQNTWVSEIMVTVDENALLNNPFFKSYLAENMTTFWFSPMSDEVSVKCILFCQIYSILIKIHK